MLTVNLILVAILIFATAFFVATEFAIVKLRPSRVDQMVLEGRKHALAVQKVTSNLDGYLSACQLGITITALGLGWLGKPTVEQILYPLFSNFSIPAELISLLSFLIAFSAITYLHVVLGELAPKSLAIQKAEQITVLCARPIIFFYKVMYPIIWVLNGSANRIIRAFGLRPAKEHEEAHTEEELRIILTESYKSGNINQAEYGYVERIFAFDELLSREIMVPRTDMVCLDINAPLQTNLAIMREEQFTRFPVIDGDKDHIVGILNTKQFFLNQPDSPMFDVSKLLQPVATASDSTPINNLLKTMQKNRVHMMVLLDEYGGTSGLITIEDILEEIVGEIRDEFDTEEQPDIEQLGEDHYILEGKVALSTVSELLHTEFEDDEEYTSIGGWLYSRNATVRKGSRCRYREFTFIVREKDKHRIRRIEIVKEAAMTDNASSEDANAHQTVEERG